MSKLCRLSRVNAVHHDNHSGGQAGVLEKGVERWRNVGEVLRKLQAEIEAHLQINADALQPAGKVGRVYRVREGVPGHVLGGLRPL